MILLMTTSQMRQKLHATLLLSCLDAVQRDVGQHSEVDLSQNKEERYSRVPRLSDSRY